MLEFSRIYSIIMTSAPFITDLLLLYDPHNLSILPLCVNKAARRQVTGTVAESGAGVANMSKSD